MTSTEEKTKGDQDVVPDWAIGYSMMLPCDKRNPPCDKEAEWFGNQHGCIRAHVCDYHMQRCYADVNAKLAIWGSVQCRKCKMEFPTFPSFIKAVRI